MASKALVLFFVVGLWASQTSTAFAPSREPRGIPELLDFAKTKLVETLKNAEDAVRSSVEVVYKNIEKLETEVLKTGTEQLYARGIKVNLTALAGIFKNNINMCVNDEKIKAEAMAIVTDIGSCVSKDSKALKTLIGDMQSLWSTAQDLPGVMEAVSKQCGEHQTVDIKTDALKEFTDNSDHDLALKSNEILEHANKHLTKRDLWIVGRINRCMRAVYDLTKNDLVTIPGQILSIAANGMKIASNAQKNMQPCIAIKVGSQSAAIAKLTLEVSSCVAEGVSTGEDMEAVLAASPGLAGLKQLADVADNLNKMKGSSGLALANEALKAVGAVGTVMG